MQNKGNTKSFNELSAYLSFYIKQPSVLKTTTISIFEWPLNTCLTVLLSGNAGTDENK